MTEENKINKAKKIKKIIFLVETFFSARDFRRFGIEEFDSNGFDCYVIEFTPMIHSEYAPKAINHDPIKFSNHFTVSNKFEMIALLNEHKDNSFIISVLQYTISTYPIFKYISKLNIPYAILAWQAVLFESRFEKSKFTIVSKILNKIKRLSLQSIKKDIINYMPLKLLNLKPANYVFIATKKSNINLKLLNKITKKVYIHALDYDNFLGSIKPKSSKNKKIIFLDQYLPLHSDQLIIKAKNRPLPEEYFPNLCKYFDKVEKMFDVNVVIAAHPRSDKKALMQLYNGRDVFQNGSNSMRDCLFCFAHYSMSINYPIMFKKPIVFITTNSLQKSSLAYKVKKVAKYFESDIINVDDDFSSNKLKKINFNRRIYKRFMNDFIKSKNSEVGMFWEVVIRKIKLLK